jgi:urease accessory protein
MNLVKITEIKSNTLRTHTLPAIIGISLVTTLALLEFLAITKSAIAHHPMGGEIPNNFITGFISGLAHPIIGLDHFAFIIASGLIVIGLNSFWFVPTVFVSSTIIGTMIHLQSVNLPLPETVIALSLILFGALIASKNYWLKNNLTITLILTTLAGIAGIFHGYAYGESIVGAEMTPLLSYLIGFTLIQLALALSAYYLGKLLINNMTIKSVNIFRFIGLAIASVGLTYLFA